MSDTKEIQKHIGDLINVPEIEGLRVFNQRLEKDPPSNWIKENQGANYIPIRIIEQMLRTMFGVYQIEWASAPQIIGNSVVCSVHLKVYHPILKEWLSYAGVGAVPIQLKSSKHTDGARHALDFERINPMALHKNIPAAKSFAVNNAAKNLGNLFGANINSKEDEVIPIMDAYKPEKAAHIGLAQLAEPKQ